MSCRCLCDGNFEQHRFRIVVILEQAHICQWDSHGGVLTLSQMSMWPVRANGQEVFCAGLHSETAVGDVQGRGPELHRL